LNKSFLDRLMKVEEKLKLNFQRVEDEKKCAKADDVLGMFEYLCRQMEMTMSPEELRQSREESLNCLVERYVEFSQLSPEEQNRQRKTEEERLLVELEQFRAWRNSEQRKRFDIDYSEYQKRLCQS